MNKINIHFSLAENFKIAFTIAMLPDAVCTAQLALHWSTPEADEINECQSARFQPAAGAISRLK